MKAIPIERCGTAHFTGACPACPVQFRRTYCSGVAPADGTGAVQYFYTQQGCKLLNYKWMSPSPTNHER